MRVRFPPSAQRKKLASSGRLTSSQKLVMGNHRGSPTLPRGTNTKTKKVFEVNSRQNP